MINGNGIICKYGECTSTEELKNFIELVCELPGCYEVGIETVNGEEAVLHCGDHRIQHALWRDLSGLDALSVIFSWDRVNLRIEAVPVLPHATISGSLGNVFDEVSRKNIHQHWWQKPLNS